MATEEEAREAVDGKEVQVEAVDLEPFHMQTHLDSKLSSVEIKNVGEIIDSTQGTLKTPYDQVLVEAPSEIKLPPEHTLNGTSSSLNGHMDEENKISNEHLHEDSKKDHEQVEVALDGERTYQNNKEANDCVSHGETTREDSSLLKHEKEQEPKGDDKKDQDPKPDTLKTDSDIDQSQLVVDQLDPNMDPAKATKDTQPASMANIPNNEVVTEPLAGLQSPLDPNLDDSNAILGTVDGSTKPEEATREDGAIHLEHRESFPEDTSTAKHTEEVVKAEDQQSKQADATDADAVQEDIPKCEETGVTEKMPKSEHADESTIDAQEVFHQEPSEVTSDLAYEKKEQTSQQSSMAASDDTTSEHDSTTCEPSADIRVQNKETLEEMKDAEAVDGEAAMQQSCAAFEEAIPECHVTTMEQDSVETNNTETVQTHNVKTVPSSEEDKVENGATARGPTSGSQEADNVGSTEEIMDNIAENIVEATNVATVDEADKEKNMLRADDIAEKNMGGIESEVTKSTEPVETEEDSDQRHVSLLDDSAHEDNTSVSEKQQTGSALEINEIEATRTEAVPQESNASFSEEPSTEDYATEGEATCDAKEVNTTEALEAIEGDNDTKTREISDQNNMDSSGKSTQENNAPESELTSDILTQQEQESEEMKDTELDQVNESSAEINATVLHKQTQENNPTTRELHVMESEGGVSSIEATEMQATPQQQAIEPQNISQQSILSPSEESVPEKAKEDIVTIEPGDGHQQPQDPEFAELDKIETNKSQEIASSSRVSNYEEPTSEDNVTVTEPNPETQAENLQSAEIMEGTENVKGDSALAGEAAQEENVEAEAIVDISPLPALGEAKNTEPVETEYNITPSDLPAEMVEKETVEIEAISHKSPVASIKEVTENDILTEITPHADIQLAESVEDKGTNTTEKPRDTQHSASDERIPIEDNMAMAEPDCETSLQNVIAQGIKDSEDAQTDQFSNHDSLPTPGEAAQKSKLPRIEPISDVQNVQELGSTEEIGGIEAAKTEDHQQHRVSTLEEPAVDNKPNVDDHQVHEEKPAEFKVNKAIEAGQVLEQSNISTPDNAPEESSEVGNDTDCCVQPAQQVESSRESEDSKLLNEEETSDQKIITLEDTAAEDIAADEIDPPVGMEQEQEQKSEKEVKDTSADEAKEDFDTSQPDALAKLASESNIAETEPVYEIQRLNDFETKEMKSTEGTSDGYISSEQTEIATSLEPSPTENKIAPQEHLVESHEENLGNEAENAMLAHGMKNEIQTSAEQKDDEFHSGETVLTTKKNLAEEDVSQSSREDIQEISNSTDQIKGDKAGTEHSSSKKSSEHHGENITHVQDKDINRELVTGRGIAEASQALIENGAQASRDVTEKDDIMKSGEQTKDHEQAGDVEHQPQTCDSSLDDEAVQKVSLDERHNEDEEVESQKEQLQADEQKQKYEGDDVSNEPLVESMNTKNGTTNRTEETDTLEAGQTEAVVHEILKIEQALQTTEDSTPSITDTTVEDITGTDKGVEEENRPNSANTSDADAKMDKQEDKENTGKDNRVPMDSTSGQDETTDEIVRVKTKTTDEITNEELETSLASSVQEISHTSPSKDHILENDPIAVPYNAESGGHTDKECTNKINDDLLAIQEPEKEIVAGMQENEEMQNEIKDVHHAESHIKAEEEEMSQLSSDEPCNVDTKIDDTTHNTTVQPREIEDIGENKGLSSIYKPVVETSEQNDDEQDWSIHHEVEDEELESTEDNAVELEATQEKVDTSNVDTNNDDQLSISNSFTKHEIESADDVLQLETEGSTSDKADETVLYEKTEARNTSVPATVTFNEEICDKVTGTEGGLSDGSLKTFDDTRRNLDVSSVVTESNEESMNEDMEEHKLAAPAHPTMGENAPKQEISVSEKLHPTEAEEQEDDQIHKEQNEEDMHEPDFGDDQKEVEQDLPVSNFLMNLILGKENSDANGHSEPEAETKQEDDNNCLIIPKQEESLALLPTENNVEDKLAVEEEKKDVKCSEEKHEVVEEQSHNLKLGTETSLETDAELNKNSHHLELQPYQDKMQDEISNEILPEEAAEVFTKTEAKDIAIPNIKQDDREVDTVCQDNTEVATQNEFGSLNNNLDDLNNTTTSEEEVLGKGQTGLLTECLDDARSVNSVSEQTFLSTESGMTDAKKLPTEADSVPNPVCEIQDKTTESSNIGATSIPDIQVESAEDKTKEKQPTTTATGEVAEEHLEISNDDPQKSIGSEATSNEQESQIAEQVSDAEIALGHEKEISAGSSPTFMDKKEESNVPVIKEGNNIQTGVEIRADGSDMQINQDKQEAADNKTEMESEKLEESNIQEKQGNGEEKSPKECHEEEQQCLVKSETVIKEEDAHENVKSHTETVKIKANDEQDLSDSKVQERDLNVFSPKNVRKPEENLMDTAKPKFSTDEEQSPKADELNMSEQKIYERKTKDEEKIENFTDEAMKTEAQIAGQKAARKKQNLLSGVGSKVKHQLAKVKKVITGKPGHTKPESPK